MDRVTEEINRLNEQVTSLFPTTTIELGELFELLLQGKITDVIKLLMENVGQTVYGDVRSFTKVAMLLICVGMLAALLHNLTELFENKQIGDIC